MGFVFQPLLAQTLVLGIFGGAGLVLVTLYSRRGPMIFPVYAALLAGLTVLAGVHRETGFVVRFVAMYIATLAATLMLFIGVSVSSAKSRRRDSELLPTPASPTVAGTRKSALLRVSLLPVVLGVLAAASAGAAFISM
jgi:hypothetical protein